jgi:hypothetical protein
LMQVLCGDELVAGILAEGEYGGVFTGGDG